MPLIGEQLEPQYAAPDTDWRNAVVYQVYPRSFQDDGEQGEGTIPGITSRLGHIQSLGAGALWLSPFYPSPMRDGGYDIANHTDVDPRYGTLDDFKEMTQAARERGIKVMVDLVPNHTSDKHPWFQESRSSRDNPKADWYIWQDPRLGGRLPNNWASVFSQSQLKARQRGDLWLPDGELTPPLSAWEYDPQRDQYYLHSFAKEQPDLNWQNEDVRKAIKDVMRFWIERGVDGFRIDAVPYIGKDPLFADEELDPAYIEGEHNPYDQLKRFYSMGYPPTFYYYLRELLSVADEYPDRDIRIIFEAYMPPDDVDKIDRLRPEVASSFNFGRMQAPWDAATHQALLNDYYGRLPKGAIGNQVNGNHDNPRLATRLGAAAARVAAVINYTVPGMVFVYNGEEGGFVDVDVPPERCDDRLGFRDGCRTPTLWDGSPNAGFSRAAPDELWLPIDPAYRTRNLAVQARDPASSLRLYQRLGDIRRNLPALRGNTYAGLQADDSDVLAYARRTERAQAAVVANFSGDRSLTVRVPNAGQVIGRVLLSTHPDRHDADTDFEQGVTLAPNEAILVAPSA